MARGSKQRGGDQNARRPDGTDRETGGRLREQRLRARLTQEALANALGVSYQQVQKYEKGASRMSGGRLRQAAALFGIPLSEIVGEPRLTPGARGAAPSRPEGATAATGFAEPGEARYEPPGLSPDARELLGHFGAIQRKEDRETLLRVAQALARS